MLLKSVAGTIGIAANVAVSKVIVPKVKQTINTWILLLSSNFVSAKVVKMYLDKYRYKKESLEQLPLAQMLQFQKSQFQRLGKHH